MPQTREELEERNRRMQCCVRSFLLYLLGCTLFAGKSNKHMELIFLEAMEDLARMDHWLWGGMTLAHLYHYLHESTLASTKTMCSNITLLMVINYNCVCFSPG